MNTIPSILNHIYICLLSWHWHLLLGSLLSTGNLLTPPAGQPVDPIPQAGQPEVLAHPAGLSVVLKPPARQSVVWTPQAGHPVLPKPQEVVHVTNSQKMLSIQNDVVNTAQSPVLKNDQLYGCRKQFEVAVSLNHDVLASL